MRGRNREPKHAVGRYFQLCSQGRAGWIVVVVLGSLGALHFARGALDRTDIVFRSVDDYASVLSVLDDPVTWNTLGRLSGPYELARVRSTDGSAYAGVANEGVPSTAHIFRFRARDYRDSGSSVDLRVFTTGDGVDFRVLSHDIVKRHDLRESETSARTRHAMLAFRAFLRHSQVRSAIEEALTDNDVGSIAFERLDGVDPLESERRYRVRVQLIVRNQPSAEIVWSLSYDRQLDALSNVEREN